MVVKKVAVLSEEEAEVLKHAGGIIKALVAAKENGEIDEFTEDSNRLLKAVKDVAVALCADRVRSEEDQ